MRAHDGSQTVVRVCDAARPFPHRLGNGVLQRRGTVRHRYDLRSEKTHFIYVKRLALRVLFPHEHNTFHSEQGRRRGSRHAVLSGAGLGDKTGLSHFFCEQCLSEHIVDLVCARMVKILSFQVDLRPAEVLRHFFRVIQPARPSRVFIEQRCELFIEDGVVFVMIVGFLELDHRIHESLRDILPSVPSKSAFSCHNSSSVVFCGTADSSYRICKFSDPCRVLYPVRFK